MGIANLSVHSIQDSSPVATSAGVNQDEEGRKPSKSLPRLNKLSFEEYLQLWKGIATSNPSKTTFNILGEYLKTDHQLQKAHFQLSRAELEQEVRLQMAEHRKLMYGTVGGKDRKYADSVGSTRSLATRTNILRHVYVGKPSKLW